VENFKLELEIPYMWMAIEVNNVLQPFLSFASTFESHRTHNMLDLIIDPCTRTYNVLPILWAWIKIRLFSLNMTRRS
jgi:hypothetical protein